LAERDGPTEDEGRSRRRHGAPARENGQVAGEGDEVAERARGVGPIDALVELVEGQPAGRGVLAQGVDDPLAVVVGCPEIETRARAVHGLRAT
jgi:hypothetical protein